jgi:DNA-binding transcriptional MocR family regulator
MVIERGPQQTLVDSCVQWVRKRIGSRVLRPGMRVPSIRSFARQASVSPFTVVEAYERLVAAGDLEPRKGSGFYVRERSEKTPAPKAETHATVDFTWLMSHMLQPHGAQGPGLGVLPASWLKGTTLGATMRSLGRQNPQRWLQAGTLLGYEPLRGVLQEKLAQFDIVAHPDQIVLTTGTTHALDLVVRVLVRPGDSVLILDPCWFGVHGLLASHGARVVAVPCTDKGPDLGVMEQAIRRERPRLMILSSAAQNPTGASLSRATVTRILAMAKEHDVWIFEDDVYADLCDSQVTRLAAADRLQRVIYSTSFSKTLASNLRVGLLACRSELARSLAEMKIVTGFTTPELNERLIYKLLVEGRYARHAKELRERLAGCRQTAKQLLTKKGIAICGNPVDGMFLWVDMRTDTSALAAAWREQGLLLAPGAVFSPERRASSWMRFNVTTTLDERVLALLSALPPTRASISTRTI